MGRRLPKVAVEQTVLARLRVVLRKFCASSACRAVYMYCVVLLWDVDLLPPLLKRVGPRFIARCCRLV